MDVFENNHSGLPEEEGREDGAQPSPRNSRGRWFGRGIYGSKDVPIRALDACIVLMIVLCVFLTAWNSVRGGFAIGFDGGGADAKIASQTVRYGKLVAEPETPDRPGYDLKGWSTSADTYTPWNFQTSTVSGDMTLYALWTPAKIPVKFDLAGGSWSGGADADSLTVTYGQPYGALPAPVREGYSFDGWIYSGEQITAETTVRMTGEHVLTARWK